MDHITKSLYCNRHFKRFLDVLVYSSVYLAFGGACLIYASCLLLGVEPRIDLMFIAFLTIYSIYNLDKIAGKREDEINVPDRFTMFTKYETYLNISALLAFLTAILLSYMSSGIEMVGVVVFFLIIFILYGVRWIPKSISKYSRLKEIPVVKNIVTSFAWAWIATFIPVVFYITVNGSGILIVFTLIFFLTFMNALFFDIRDIEGDKISGILTIPVFFGFHKTRTFLLVLNTFMCAFIFIFTFNGLIPVLTYMLIGIVGYYYAIIYLMDKLNNRAFICDVLVDGDIIIVGVLVFFGAILF